MKKFIATTLIAAMTLSMVACSNEAKQTAEETAQIAGEVANEVASVAENATGLYLKDINPSEYVTLGNYIGLTPSFEKEIVDDAKVQQYLDYLPYYYQTETPVTDRAAEIGDTANINYEGKIDGTTFEGGTATGSNLELGSHTYIEGFEDGVVGMKIGETKELNLTFPENYTLNEELSGKAVVFTVKLNSLTVKTIPELDDEFAKTLGEDNLEALRASVKQELTNQSESDYQTRLMDDLEKQVKENSTFKELPAGYVDRIYNQLLTSLKNYAAQAGATEAQVAQYYFGITSDDYEQGLKDYSEEIAKDFIMLGAIAAENNITVTPEEINTDLQKMIDDNGLDVTIDEFKQNYISEADHVETLLMTKVEEFIVSKANL